MRTTWKQLSNETKRGDSVELSRFFVFGDSKEMREKIRKVFFLFMVLGLVGLMCGCELGTTALSESDISDDYNEDVKKSLRKLIATGNCEECPLMGVDISGKDLSHKDLTKANLRKANLQGADLRKANLFQVNLYEVDLTGVNLDSAIKCHTIMPWGEDNSGC